MKLVDFSQIMRFLTDTVEYSLDVNYKLNEAKAPKNLYQQFYVMCCDYKTFMWNHLTAA